MEFMCCVLVKCVFYYPPRHGRLWDSGDKAPRVYHGDGLHEAPRIY